MGVCSSVIPKCRLNKSITRVELKLSVVYAEVLFPEVLLFVWVNARFFSSIFVSSSTSRSIWYHALSLLLISLTPQLSTNRVFLWHRHRHGMPHRSIVNDLYFVWVHRIWFSSEILHPYWLHFSTLKSSSWCFLAVETHPMAPRFFSHLCAINFYQNSTKTFS